MCQSESQGGGGGVGGGSILNTLVEVDKYRIHLVVPFLIFWIACK